MGAASFANVASGKTAQEAFSALVAAARAENGCGGYSGSQTAFIGHKSDAGVHMDAEWLADPDREGATRDYLAQLEQQSGPLAPMG